MSQIFTYVISYSIEGIIAYMYMSTSFKKNKSSLFAIKMTFAFYSLQVLGTFLESSTFNTVVFFVCNIPLIYFAYKVTFLFSIFNSAVMTTLMFCTELIVNSFSNQLMQTYKTANISDPHVLPFLLSSKTLYLLSIFILIWIMKLFKGDKLTQSFGNIILTIIPFLSFVVSVSICYICTKNYLSTLSSNLLIACSLCLIIINILVFWLQNYTNRNHLRMMQLQSQLQRETDEAHYYKMLQNHDNEQRILIHDIKNHLAAIAALAGRNDYSGIQKYIDSLVSTPALNTIIDKTPNPHLNMLLSRYSAICLSKDIAFHIDVQGDGLSCVKPEELVALLSNLLDNAITAAEGTDSAYINLKISETWRGCSIMSIANSCRQNPEFGADNIPHTTKQDLAHHGYGLKSVRKILEQYNGHMTSSYDDKSRQYLVIIDISGDAV